LVYINSAGNLAAGKSVDRKEIIPDFLEMYKQRTGALIHLQNALSTVFSGTEPKVLVFVDELDRCRPDYAVSYLETIKHVFNVSGMVFVLAIDYNHLANSTRALYGQNLNFDEYFRKFCHRKIDIPEPDDKALGALAADYVKTYLSVEGKRFCGIGLRDRRKEIIDLALTLQMRPRQLQEAFRIIGHASSVDDQGSQGNLDWCVAASIILLAFLLVARRDDYLRLKDGKMSPDEVLKLLILVAGEKSAQWWFRIYLTGAEANWGQDHEKILREARLLPSGQNFDGRALSQFIQGWNQFYPSTISDVFCCIESLKAFES
jgi:KAP family P-loop domain